MQLRKIHSDISHQKVDGEDVKVICVCGMSVVVRCLPSWGSVVCKCFYNHVEIISDCQSKLDSLRVTHMSLRRPIGGNCRAHDIRFQCAIDASCGIAWFLIFDFSTLLVGKKPSGGPIGLRVCCGLIMAGFPS